ncbi:GNAT family N-acetyltransferase [Streptomyces sp. NPDC091272]|uniref:GNAT family N-acetyltransferase n=1 Tax=Streptomyces sp. NPDC091272 TaxID=3365981 RepID=UPI00381B1D15
MFGIDLDDEGAAVLRPLEPWRAEEFLAHIDRGREYIGRYIGMPDINQDLPSAGRFLQNYAEKTAADAGQIFGIWLDGTLVGGLMFRLFDAKAGTCEIGCWLEPTAAGRGLITKACTVLIDWAVDGRGIHRVEWIADAENTASLAVAKRLGMRKDGMRREAYFYRGTRHDEEIWSVLAPEWREARAGRGVRAGRGPR